MKSKNQVTGEHGVILLVSLLLSPIKALYTGWVVSILWRWFVTPLGVTPINAWHAAGVVLFATVLVVRVDIKKEPSATPTADFISGLVFSILTGLIALLFGALYHGLMA